MSLYLGENLISGQATLVGESRNIGQIISSAIPLTDAGLHLLDGALMQGNGIYSAFVDYIASIVSTYPSVFTTESAWQSSVSTYGVCGKFVYDSTNNTVRLPKVTGIIEGTTDVNALGDLVQAGLPNIQGSAYLHAIEQANIFNDVTGVLRGIGGSSDSYRSPSSLGINSGAKSSGGITLDASRSSSIYGNSSTVQPQTIKCYYYIVIATSTKTDIEVDIDNVVTDLNGKADRDLSNLNATGQAIIDNKANTDLSNINPNQMIKKTIMNWGKPNYSSGITISTNTSYTALVDGWVNVNLQNNGGRFYINSIEMFKCNRNDAFSDSNSAFFPISTGDVVLCNKSSIIFYPNKGV